MSTTLGDFNSAEQEPYQIDERDIGFADTLVPACATTPPSETINDGREREVAPELHGLTWLQVLRFLKEHGFGKFLLPSETIDGTSMSMEIRSVETELAAEEAALPAPGFRRDRVRYFIEVAVTRGRIDEGAFIYRYPRPACLTEDIVWTGDGPSRLPAHLLVENVCQEWNEAHADRGWNFKTPYEVVGLRPRCS